MLVDENVTFSAFQERLDDEEEENSASPASHHLATAMGVKSHRMQVMKASFFGQSDEPQQYINNNDMRPREFRPGNKSVLSSTGFDEFDGKSIHEHPIYSPMKTKSLTIYPEPRDDTRTAKERKIGLIILLPLYFTVRLLHFNVNSRNSRWLPRVLFPGVTFFVYM